MWLTDRAHSIRTISGSSLKPPEVSSEVSNDAYSVECSHETLTSQVETKQYNFRKCEWSDKVVSETFTFYRVK